MSVRILSLVLASTLGCANATAPSTEPEPDAAARASETGETGEASELVSVRPGVNDKYARPDTIETWTDTLERERREVIAKRDEIVAALELAPGMVVADIGAGTGAFMAAISVEVGESGMVYAVDIIPQFLAHLRERAAAEGLDNVEIIEASATATNLPDASVDLLFICDVYHHIEYPAVYLRSLHRALRPGGRMVIVEFDKVPGKTSAGMMKHVRQDKATLLAEVTAEGFVLEREVDSVELDENYMLVFRPVEPEPEPEPVAAMPPPPVPVQVDPGNYRMVLAGDIVIGGGGVGLVAMIVGLGLRSDALSQRRALGAAIDSSPEAIARQEQRFETGTILAITGGAAAGALFATGISLVALGYSRERKRREALDLLGRLAPMLGRERVGVSWLVRF